jgi:uncharacterized protein (TIGR03435 family)
MTRIVLAGVFTAAAISVLAGQEVKPSFEVTSVRRNLSGPSSTPTQQIRPGGVFVAQNQLLARLIAFAYSVDDFRVIGGPGWMRDARYDVDARANGDMSNEQLRRMLQSLLESRFALVVHREQREMTIYSLLLVGDDARLGLVFSGSISATAHVQRSRIQRHSTPAVLCPPSRRLHR